MYKRLLVTVLVSVFVFSLWGKTETVCQSLEVEDSVPVFQKDTLPVKGSLDFLRIKRIGRYDRGIMNYRFIPKGKWISGFTMSYWDYNSADNKLLPTLIILIVTGVTLIFLCMAAMPCVIIWCWD